MRIFFCLATIIAEILEKKFLLPVLSDEPAVMMDPRSTILG
jgi:hypothetical protein